MSVTLAVLLAGSLGLLLGLFGGLEFGRYLADRLWVARAAGGLDRRPHYCRGAFYYVIEAADFVRGYRLAEVPWLSRCARCGSRLALAGRCSDETCPFAEHHHLCPAGWVGHPERADGPCACGFPPGAD